MKKQTSDTAALFGLGDRGTIEVGKRADLNLIDHDALQLETPELVYDLRLVAADYCSGHGATEPRSSPVRSPDARRGRHGRSSGTTGPRSPLNVRFGVGLPVAHHPVPEWASSLEAITAVTRAAAAAGFEHVFVTDHPAPPQRWLAAGGHSSLDPFVALTAAVAADPGIRVLTNLSVLGYRHPSSLRRVRRPSTGFPADDSRSAWGGYLAAEFDALGVSFDERNDRFDHALDVLDAVWRGQGVEITEGDGRTSVVLPDPPPVQQPIPIWIGGNAGRLRQRVAERAQGWMPMPNPAAFAKTTRSPVLDGPEDLSRFITDLHRRADEAGRDDPIDIVFVVPDGGQPGSAGFQAEVHRRAIDECAALGVTGNNVTLDTTSLEHTLDVIGCYGADVIGARSS